jgi:hypothetical protein
LRQLGLRVEYQVIANMEAGRRANVPVTELFILAAALGVPPAMLVLPVGTDTDVEIRPGRTADAWTAYRWFTGLGAERLPGEDIPPEPAEVADQLNVYRRHDEAMLVYALSASVPDGDEEGAEIAAAQLRALVAVRNEIRRAGWRPPALPPEIAPTVEAAEKESARR